MARRADSFPDCDYSQDLDLVPVYIHECRGPSIRYSWFTELFAQFIELISYMVISSNTIMYVVYFHIWGNLLQNIERTSGRDINLEFFEILASIIIPVQVWILISFVLLSVGLYHLVMRQCFFLAPRHPVVSALSTLLSAVLYSMMNIYFFTFNQFLLNELLRCQGEKMGLDITGLFVEGFENLTMVRVSNERFVCQNTSAAVFNSGEKA